MGILFIAIYLILTVRETYSQTSENWNTIFLSPGAFLARDFLLSGCVQKMGTKLDCSALSLEEKFACDIFMVDASFKSLSPNVSMVECKFGGGGGLKGGMLVTPGAYLGAGSYVKYLVFSGDRVVELKNESAFERFFAPVNSSEEALAFVLGVHPHTSARDVVEVPQGYTLLVSKDELKPTTVVKNEDGFEINVFFTDFITCGAPIPTYEETYTVTNEGNVTIISQKKLFKGSAGMCT